MRPIEDFANWLTDVDWGWWPVLHLRPQKNQNIDNRVLIKITPSFGSGAGLIIFFLGGFSSYSIGNLILSLFIGWIAFFLAYKITCATAWNRRAERLRAEEAEK
jgi:hypothetical protein